MTWEYIVEGIVECSGCIKGLHSGLLTYNEFRQYIRTSIFKAQMS